VISIPERGSGVVGGKEVAVGSGVGEGAKSVGGCAVGVATAIVGGMEVIVGGTVVAEGVNVDAGVGCMGPEQAANRNRMQITAWGLIFFMIAPPCSLQRKIR
jgi:hypothetical protein